MSAIGSSGFIPQTNPYAGNITTTKDSDAARTDSAGRAVEGDRAQSAQNLNQPEEAGRSEDRDADGFFTPGGSGRKEGSSESDRDDDAQSFNGSLGHETAGTVSEPPVDDHRGNLINFDV